jgi:2,3-bisphosphoglycerate-independent phosphoglycerate mutase
MSFDIEPLDAPGATGSYDSDFASKAAVACGALVSGGFDFALLHVKAVDDTGHDRMLAMKVRGAAHAFRLPNLVSIISATKHLSQVVVSQMGGGIV